MLSVSANAYLDTLAVAPKSVWSLRKMISTATRSIRVRRSSASTQMDIGFIGKNLDTGALLAFVGSGNGFVTMIYDQTGNGLNANAPGTATQPLIVRSGSLLDGVTFNGTSNYLSLTTYPFSQSKLGVYLKMRQDPTTTRIIYESTVNFNLNPFSVAFYTESSKYAMGMNNATSGTQKINYQGLTLTTTTQASLLYDRSATGNAETMAYQGGTLVGVTNVPPYTNEQSGTFASTGFYLGARNGTSLFMNGMIETMVIYDGDSTSIRAAIEAVVA